MVSAVERDDTGGFTGVNPKRLFIGSCFGVGAGVDNYLFLAGSAINGIKNPSGQSDPALGAEAMRHAIGVFRENVFTEVGPSHPAELKSYADAHGLDALGTAISQRYGL